MEQSIQNAVNVLNMKKSSILLLALFVTVISTAQTKIHQGDGTYASNKVLLTIDGNKIRVGDGTYSSNKVVFTIDGTKIREGDGTYSSNKVLFTIDGNKIRQGDGTYSSNKVLYTIEGSLAITKIACLLFYIL